MMKTIIRNIMIMGAAVLAGALSSCSEDYAEAPATLPPGGIGSGAWDSPMTAYQCHIGSINEAINPAWVKGYIVGVCDVSETNVMSERTLQYEGPFSTATNLIMADNPIDFNYLATLDEDGIKAFRDSLAEQVITVQLPSGPVRTALNVADNPNNINKQVCIKGTTGSKYCSVYGLRDCSAYNWGETGKEESGPVGPGEAGGPLYQDFDSSTDISTYINKGWKNEVTQGGLSGWFIKNFSGNNYASVNALKGTTDGGPYVMWLISPAVDMEKLTDKTLEFRTQASYPAENCTLEVYVMTTDNPFTSKSSKLNAAISQPPASGYSDWVESGKLDLSAYTGTIYIGWRYYAAHGGENGSSTYCVDNVNIGNASTEPSEPPTPVEEGTFAPATTLSETGSYIMVTSDGKVAKPIGESLSYGYLTVEDATLADGKITTPMTNAITITKSEKGYTMLDSFNRYISMDDNESHKSFQLYASVQPGSEWTITLGAGGEATITNVLRGSWIGWAQNYSNFAPQSSAQSRCFMNS